MKYTPVLIFTYNRADHLKNLINSLKKCNEFDNTFFYIFSDGPKDSKDITQIENVRKLINESFTKNFELINNRNNEGLAKSVINGISYVFKSHNSLIVLEDDLILSENFLRYMNNGLIFYENNYNVYQISGFSYMNDKLKSNETFFLPTTTSWGWATWKRSWDKFSIQNPLFDTILNDNETKFKFDLNGNYPYSKMLSQQLKKNINSWAIIWYATVFLNDGLVVYPPRSLVNNNGFDGSGTHGNNLIPSYNRQFNLTNFSIIFSNDIKINNRKLVLYQKSIKNFMPNKFTRIFFYILNRIKNIKFKNYNLTL